ncbi:MAG: PIN domain-containing protein [Alphaproteobacteria bacterium]|nr:PIN domain-containing protein [Alphaproteobacteria bacterium]
MVVHLDTHVVMWLYNRQADFLSSKVSALLKKNEQLFVSPMVLLEIQYMHEIKRLEQPAAAVKKWLEEHTSIKVAQTSFMKVIEKAKTLSWTRDAFDRLITATASAENAALITKDRVIQKHYKKAVW